MSQQSSRKTHWLPSDHQSLWWWRWSRYACCTLEGELVEAIAMTKAEAKAAFNNDMVYMEKFLENPRHVEVQVIADGQGGAIHLR